MSGILYMPHGVIKVYGVALNVMQNTWELWDHFLPWYAVYWRDELLTWRLLASHGILSRYSQYKLTIAIRSGYKIIIVV